MGLGFVVDEYERFVLGTVDEAQTHPGTRSRTKLGDVLAQLDCESVVADLEDVE